MEKVIEREVKKSIVVSEADLQARILSFHGGRAPAEGVVVAVNDTNYQITRYKKKKKVITFQSTKANTVIEQFIEDIEKITKPIIPYGLKAHWAVNQVRLPFYNPNNSN